MKRFLGIPVLGVGLQTMPEGIRVGRFKIQFWVANLAVLTRIAGGSRSILGGLSYLFSMAFGTYHTSSSLEITCFFFTGRVTDTKYMYLKVKK